MNNLNKFENHTKEDEEKIATSCETCKKFSNIFCSNKSEELDNFESSFRKVSRLVCPYLECDERFSNYHILRTHLCQLHDVDLYLEINEFSTVKDFEKWKGKIEKQTLSRYVLNSAPKKLINDTEKRYYDCSRSYHYIPKGKGLRSLKMSGSTKTGRACPARLEVTIQKSPVESLVKVLFFKTHYGHNLGIDNRRLDKETKSLITEKLKEGQSFDQILEYFKNITSTVQDTNKKLLHVTRKDLHNIARTFKNDKKIL